jgi:hypothetical protein
VSDLSELFKVLAEGKRDYEENHPVGKKLKEVKTHAKEDLSSLFAQLTSLKEGLEKELVVAEENQIINEIATLVAEETLTEEIPAQPIIHTPEVRAKQVNADVNKYLTDKSFQNPQPEVVNKDVESIRNKIKFLEQAIGRIAAAGPGSGEVNFRWLDDVDRASISPGRFLTYNPITKLFTFDEINTQEVVYNTTIITTPTYTVQPGDYYIGVDYAGPCTITLPATATSGRTIIIKDEDGDAETYPITVEGNVDNDAGGFIIQINNGAIQLIYRNGWRII